MLSTFLGNLGKMTKKKDWKSDLLALLKADPANFDLEKVVTFKDPFLPKKIYRYRPLRTGCPENEQCLQGSHFDRELENLSKNLVWLSNPKDYNDPFDSLVHFSDALLFARLNQEMLDQFSKTLKTPLSSEKISAILKSPRGLKELISLAASEHKMLTEEQRNKAVKELNAYADKTYLDLLTILNQIIRQGALVCSFSERTDSTLMWSHYASDHKGFCVEYTLEESKDHEIRRFLFPVIYAEALTDVSSQFESKTGDKKGIGLTACVSKALDWEYEREWRLVLLLRPNAPGRAYQMPRPSKIFLGARIDKTHETKILEIAERIGTKVSRMELSRDSYRMIEKELEFLPSANK